VLIAVLLENVGKLRSRLGHPLPVSIGDRPAHAAAEEFKRLRLGQEVNQKLCLVAECLRRAVVTVDQRPSKFHRKRHHDPGAQFIWRVLDVARMDADVLQPRCESSGIDPVQHRGPSEFARRLQAETQGEELDEFLA
jgi:hypothetical protein